MDAKTAEEALVWADALDRFVETFCRYEPGRTTFPTRLFQRLPGDAPLVDAIIEDNPLLGKRWQAVRDACSHLDQLCMNAGTYEECRDALRNVGCEVHRLAEAVRQGVPNADIAKAADKLSTRQQGRRRQRKHSDEDCRKYEATFEQFRRQGMEAKQAWIKTAKCHGLESGDATREAVYRWKRRQTPAK